MTEPRTLTEAEANAIIADRVTRETAELNTRVSTLETEKAALQSELDVAQANLATETTARETAERELADFKASVETEREQARLQDERTAAVKAAVPTLKDDYFTPERAARWAKMSEEDFNGLVEDMKPAAPIRETAGLEGSSGTTGRETAGAEDDKPSVGAQVLSFGRGA